MSRTRNDLHDMQLTETLQALPDETLNSETRAALWAEIDTSLNTESTTDAMVSVKSPVRYWSLAMAAAAVVMLVMVLEPVMQEVNPDQAIADASVADTLTTDDALAILQARSQLLEARLRQLKTPAALSGQEALAIDELERMIGLVDLQLTASTGGYQEYQSPSYQQQFERASLWQQRVDLMQTLVATRLSDRGGYIDHQRQPGVRATNTVYDTWQ